MTGRGSHLTRYIDETWDPDAVTRMEWAQVPVDELDAVAAPIVLNVRRSVAPASAVESWRESANCLNVDPSLFYPDAGVRAGDVSAAHRRRIVWRVKVEGWSADDAAAEAGCSYRAARRWVARWEAGEELDARNGSERNEDASTEAAAKAVCAGCTVRAECLNSAIEHREHGGIWGGMGEIERKAEARRRRLAGRVAS